MARRGGRIRGENRCTRKGVCLRTTAGSFTKTKHEKEATPVLNRSQEIEGAEEKRQGGCRLCVAPSEWNLLAGL